jgi:hypothetical protein
MSIICVFITMSLIYGVEMIVNASFLNSSSDCNKGMAMILECHV